MIRWIVRPSTALLAVLLGVAPRAARADVGACLEAAESGQARRAAGKLIESKRDLLACAVLSCPTSVRADCVRWLVEVEAAVPSILVRAHDEHDQDLGAVTVTIDGGLAGSTLDGRPIVLNPGSHSLRFSAPGRVTVDQVLVIRQSEHNRLVSVAMLAPRGRVLVTKEGASVAPISWALWGGGTLAAVAGSVLWILGSGEHGDLENGCKKTATCLHDDVVGARTKLIAGDVLVATGIVALGIGLYVALTRPPQAKTQAGLRF